VGAKKLLESVTYETLHAHNFSRSSSQASQVLTDLLSRYLTLLTTSCAKYAEHAGRLSLSIRDAVSALDELGVGVDELNEYCATEGKDLSRYAVHTAKRVEDLTEFKGQLSCAPWPAHFHLLSSQRRWRLDCERIETMRSLWCTLVFRVL